MNRALMIAIALAMLAVPLCGQYAWRPLFDGRSLDGWYPCNGTARLSVEDGAIVGRTVVDSPNTFRIFPICLALQSSFGLRLARKST